MKVPSLGIDRGMPPITTYYELIELFQWLSLGDQVIIIFIIIFLNSFVYPRVSIKIETRFIIGMVCATLAMCSSGLVEIFRVQSCVDKEPVTQVIGNQTYDASNLTIFLQFPQYIAIGVSEVFTSIASLEFAYLTAPRSAKSLIMSLRFCSHGISSFLSSGYLNLFISNPKESKQCELNGSLYFYILAGIQILFIFIIIWLNKKFNIFRILPQKFRNDYFSATDSISRSNETDA
ncbi:unnamed protein product [Didymodactylos carnosus]|uniref:Uncharacterized protein n=1 Tax=Didymodactylos carnosus TaxID=1234261 RepID=A0A8S2FNC7_9BILA|nr:unnamed protein product [Didymodactylos carnosus]CAF4307733.1 unnamed protein product [Didymodactylos carnosus]